MDFALPFWNPVPKCDGDGDDDDGGANVSIDDIDDIYGRLDERYGGEDGIKHYHQKNLDNLRSRTKCQYQHFLSLSRPKQIFPPLNTSVRMPRYCFIQRFRPLCLFSRVWRFEILWSSQIHVFLCQLIAREYVWFV